MGGRISDFRFQISWGGMLCWGLLVAGAMAAFSLAGQARSQEAPRYPWLESEPDPTQGLSARIPPPEGYERVEVEAGSFAAWLRQLPLLPGRPDVMLHDGGRKGRQDVHEAVVDIDVGTRDLQQCADAVIRLRAEYLFSAGRFDEITFDFTSGDAARYARYRDGWRASISGNSVTWNQTAARDASHAAFRRYMDLVFTYAGTASLEKELRSVSTPAQVQPGDVFIQGGFPGHAVIVLDVARTEAGRTVFLLAQSYMPAQQIHVLRNPGSDLGPWYPVEFGSTLVTPEWRFEAGDLARF